MHSPISVSGILVKMQGVVAFSTSRRSGETQENRSSWSTIVEKGTLKDSRHFGEMQESRNSWLTAVVRKPL
jgi:hypothetical protein